MKKLCFLRRLIEKRVRVLGVKSPGEPFFCRIPEEYQWLSEHPLGVQNKLEDCKTKRTSPITLSDADYELYFKNGQFCFKGKPLKRGEL